MAHVANGVKKNEEVRKEREERPVVVVVVVVVIVVVVVVALHPIANTLWFSPCPPPLARFCPSDPNLRTAAQLAELEKEEVWCCYRLATIGARCKVSESLRLVWV